jgi:hypothetical protein
MVVMTTQPLPGSLQETIWNFVRAEIRRYEDRIGAKVAQYEVHLSGGGQIEVEVLATESADDAAIDDGLEEAGVKAEVNRLAQREILVEQIEKNSEPHF